ncbi:MAG: 30S ribosome-binding factor RbfA [Gammaproteobacteria bacterium]|jgi:ribosome-binding factor A
MPREFSRASRVAAQIHRELAELFARGVGDPRLHGATVSRVEVTRDLARARVFLEVHVAQHVQETLRAAMKARGFIRRELARRIRARALPELIFAWDTELERVNRVLTLIDSTVSSGARESVSGTTPKQDEKEDE